MRKIKFLIGLICGAVLGFAAAQLAWIYTRLNHDPRRTLKENQNTAPGGTQFFRSTPGDQFEIEHSLEDGVERIVYRPHERRYQTPLLLIHGLWHGAWYWRGWQEHFAARGWESHAISLPGHAGSPGQRLVPLATLDYYLSFLVGEIERSDPKPVMIGHSMGGALIQWYLKYVGDLPAAVFVASWLAHSSLSDSLARFWNLDPGGVLQSIMNLESTGLVRSPERAARALLSERAAVSPQELHRNLSADSLLAILQHNPPFWTPPNPQEIHTPLLWLAAEADAAIGEAASRDSAAYYGADYILVTGAGHDLVLEQDADGTAEVIHTWLSDLEIS